MTVNNYTLRIPSTFALSMPADDLESIAMSSIALIDQQSGGWVEFRPKCNNLRFTPDAAYLDFSFNTELSAAIVILDSSAAVNIPNALPSMTQWRIYPRGKETVHVRVSFEMEIPVPDDHNLQQLESLIQSNLRNSVIADRHASVLNLCVTAQPKSTTPGLRFWELLTANLTIHGLLATEGVYSSDCLFDHPQLARLPASTVVATLTDEDGMTLDFTKADVMAAETDDEGIWTAAGGHFTFVDEFALFG